MNRVKNLIAISAFSLLVLGLPAIASAQWGGQNDPYGRNGGYNDPYGRNGGYNNGQYGDMRSTVRNLKNHARELQRHLDRDLDRSRYDGSRREDQLNDLARQFRTAVNRLSESNNGPRDNDVQRVLQLGSQLDRHLSRAGLDEHVAETWSEIRYDLQALGGNGYYDNNNRNNRNNRKNRYPQNYPQNRNGRNLPSWWPF